MNRQLTAIEFEGVNVRLTAPEHWDAEKHGECATLPVMRTEDGLCVSLWTLTDEQRAAIADGADLALHVWGASQPPVALVVEPAAATEEPPDWSRELSFNDVIIGDDDVRWRYVGVESYGRTKHLFTRVDPVGNGWSEENHIAIYAHDGAALKKFQPEVEAGETAARAAQ